MEYAVELTPKALADLESIDKTISKRIFAKIERLRHGLVGDVKRLKDFEPAFRLRVGDYRVLFDIRGSVIIIQYVRHRRDAYRE